VYAPPPTLWDGAASGDTNGDASDVKAASEASSDQPPPLSVGVRREVSALRALLLTLKGTATHYVRCLAPGDGPKGAAAGAAAASVGGVGKGKPNLASGFGRAAVPAAPTAAASAAELPMSAGFDRKRVAEQLESSGALAAVKMARCGYPVRWPLPAFARRYFPLAGAGAGVPKLHGAAQACLHGPPSATAAAGQAARGVVAYTVAFPDASLGFGVKFVRSGMPVVARITQAHLACRLVAGHVLTHVAKTDLADTKEQTYADARARGQDPAKEFQRAVAVALRESPRPLQLRFAGPAADAPRLSCHVALAHFVQGLEPAQLPPHLQVHLRFTHTP
jgi:hypothetical protein